MIILFGLWIGLLAGIAEVIVLELRLHVMGRFLTLSRHMVWMAPAVDAVLFTLVGVLLALGHRVFPRLVTVPRAVGVLVFGAVSAVMMHFPSVHLAAALLIAAGLGVQAARWTGLRLEATARVARSSAAGLALLVIVVAVGFLLRDRWGEGQALARLPEPRSGDPNVLLIILDTVREKNLSLYGYPRPTTPEIDAWARGGVVFDRAFSAAPWTLPSHASMFTGLHAHELATNWETPLESGPLTLAESLGRRGYATAGFVANVRYTGRETGLARGFAGYEDYRISIGEAIKSAALADAFHGSYKQKLHLPSIRPRITAKEVSRRFTRWLEHRNPERPFFVFLNYLDAHAQYQPPEPFRSRFETQPSAPIPSVDDGRPNKVVHPEARFTVEDARASMDLYDGAIAFLDSEIGRLLRELEGRGLLENTIVILSSDHGEAFGEHGMLGHANSLYRPTLQVPLVISYPGHIPAGLRVGTPVSLRDLAATITDLSGQGSGEFPGSSLARYWNGSSDGTDDSVAISQIRKLINQPDWWPASAGDMYSLVQGNWHYIVNEAKGREELFDLAGDIAEQVDLTGTSEGQRELPRLRAALARLRQSGSPAAH